MWNIRVAIVVVLIVYSSAEDEHDKSDRSEYKRALARNCEMSYSTTCLKLDIVSWVDKLNEDKNFSIFPGISIVRENVSENTADIVTDLARNFPNDPDARLDAFFLRKIQGYLNNHAIRISLFDKSEAESARKGGGGGGGGGKKGGGMGMIFAAAAMMKGTLMALALSALAAIAGKALMTAMISLLLSGIVGLKSLSGGGGGKATYEVISKPVVTHSHTSSHEDYQHGHSGYGRSFDMPLPLALQPGYKMD
ncbi:uncharacterized protein [Leptinotarsa decemlineata]|uniref:uncharacterized protein n=1 Tax=Leptinotarsa decemlineata TaxID=7539 RepID=UPI000C254104|nr:uncharacterized protein LOC111510493 [Leptinotarsa decemlineata]